MKKGFQDPASNVYLTLCNQSSLKHFLYLLWFSFIAEQARNRSLFMTIWLAFVLPEDATKMAVEEKSSTVSATCESYNLQNQLPSKVHLLVKP